LIVWPFVVMLAARLSVAGAEYTAPEAGEVRESTGGEVLGALVEPGAEL
jgi:hypothetical protein